MNAILRETSVMWQPEEIVDIGQGCRVGITTDDGCYMVLLPNQNGFWKPTNWIPKEAARRLGELAIGHCME
jgi:hypothetical protein